MRRPARDGKREHGAVEQAPHGQRRQPLLRGAQAAGLPFLVNAPEQRLRQRVEEHRHPQHRDAPSQQTLQRQAIERARERERALDVVLGGCCSPRRLPAPVAPTGRLVVPHQLGQLPGAQRRHLADAAPGERRQAQQPEPFEVGVRVEALAPGGATGRNRPVAPLPYPQHVEREARPLGGHADRVAVGAGFRIHSHPTNMLFVQ